MISSRQLIQQFNQNYARYFIREHGYRYSLVIVDNHFDNVYTVFLYTQVLKKRLIRSSELVEFPNTNTRVYQDVLAAIQHQSNLSIEFRDTEHLVHLGSDITKNEHHGHS